MKLQPKLTDKPQMHITLNYAYTQDQLKRAYRFNVFPTYRAKFSMLFFTCFIFAVGILCSLISEPTTMNALLLKALKNIILAVCLIWVAVLLAVALNYYYLPIYAFEKSPFHRGQFKITLTTEGLAYKQQIVEENNSSEREGLVKWQAFTKKAENEEFIVLFINRSHSIIPKNSFTNSEELNQFKSFLIQQKNIKTKKFNGTEIWIK